ncbi:MAG TPA: hypothetical protein VM598_04830 [Bdellovibrionota bacterium]|nr:hypothetical protein [Bdellovibrionota bacterium]
MLRIQIMSLGAAFFALAALAAPAQADPCMAAVYDEQGPNTIVYFAQGTWDDTRSICMGAIDYTRSEVKGKSARQVALENPLVYVIYVIERNKNLFHAPCGAVVNSEQVPDGMLMPGSYRLDSFSRVGRAGDFGPGSRCGITAI